MTPTLVADRKRGNNGRLDSFQIIKQETERRKPRGINEGETPWKTEYDRRQIRDNTEGYSKRKRFSSSSVPAYSLFFFISSGGE